jgi:hypothetical protein
MHPAPTNDFPQSPDPDFRRASVRLWPVASFTSAYVLAAAALCLVRGNLEFLFYVAVMVVLVSAIWVLHRRVRLGEGVLWCLSLWGLAHMAGGLLPVPAGWPISGDKSVLYSLWLFPERLKYDHVVHAYGFGVTTWVCWQALRAAALHRGTELRPTFGLLVLCAAAAMGFGALNEIVEFAATLLVPETNVGGYRNTGWDLVSNLVGAVAAATAIHLADRRNRLSRPG